MRKDALRGATAAARVRCKVGRKGGRCEEGACVCVCVGHGLVGAGKRRRQHSPAAVLDQLQNSTFQHETTQHSNTQYSTTSVLQHSNRQPHPRTSGAPQPQPLSCAACWPAAPSRRRRQMQLPQRRPRLSTRLAPGTSCGGWRRPAPVGGKGQKEESVSGAEKRSSLPPARRGMQAGASLVATGQLVAACCLSPQRDQQFRIMAPTSPTN
jgi:hypothetical protein